MSNINVVQSTPPRTPNWFFRAALELVSNLDTNSRLRTFSNVNVQQKGLLLQDWVFRLGWGGNFPL